MHTIIGVIGGHNSASEQASRLAEEVGFLIAKSGCTLICGGLTGIMESACKGAKRAGGLTIGVIPSADKHDANPHVDIPIVTAMSTSRNVIIVRTADAIIAIDGSYGTLSEIAHALDQGKKVISLASWTILKGSVDDDKFVLAHTPKEAVDLAIRFARGDEALLQRHPDR